ncbi:MAG TPA: response regulator [Gaiellaceae bacterium]|nr:response regulator [Gaiellaceae bacterium]
MPAPIRVLLVEDSDAYRDSLAFLLGRHPGIEVVGAVGEGAAAAGAAARLAPDVVVLDYRLPDVDGERAAEEVGARCPRAAVVFLSASAGEEEVAAARRRGARLVRKDEGVETLVAAVRDAAGRERAWS